MKLNKLFFILAAFVVLTFAACSKDDTTPGGVVEGKSTYVAINIKVPAATYIDGEAIGTDGNIGTTVIMAIFSTAGVLEFYKEDVAVTGIQTQIIEVKSGSKYVYVLANVPGTVQDELDDIMLVSSTMMSTFEKSVHALTIADVTVSTGFFMANLKTPALQVIEADVTDPVGEGKNVLSIEIGRLAARIQASTTVTDVHESPVPSAPVIGTISGFQSKVRVIAEYSYLIGQSKVVGGLAMNETPYFDGLKGVTGPATPAGAPYDDYANGDAAPFQDFLLPAAVPTLHTEVSYVLENSNATGKEVYGNTTRLSVKAVVIPANFVNLVDGTQVANATPAVAATFYTFVHGDITYISATRPAAEAWFAGLAPAVDPLSILEYTNGEAFYYALLAVPNAMTVEYTIMRNHVYKVDVTRVNGLGSNTPDGNIPLPPVPVKGEGSLVVNLTIVPWTVVTQPTPLS